MQELWFLYMIRRLNVLYEVSLKKNSNGYQANKRTQNSIANDQREITPKISKVMVLVHDSLCFRSV